MAETIFTKIINRDIPGHFVYEDEQCAVILDKFPAVPGQCLVIPKEPVDYIFNLDQATYTHIWNVAAQIAHALDTVYQPLRTCAVVEGFDVPHTHIKLYPITEDLKPLGQHLHMGAEASDDVLTHAAEEIKAALTS